MQVIRILVYEGTEDAIKETFLHNNIKVGYTARDIKITEAIIGYKYPTLEDELKGHVTE